MTIAHIIFVILGKLLGYVFIFHLPHLISQTAVCLSWDLPNIFGIKAFFCFWVSYQSRPI